MKHPIDTHSTVTLNDQGEAVESFANHILTCTTRHVCLDNHLVVVHGARRPRMNHESLVQMLHAWNSSS